MSANQAQAFSGATLTNEGLSFKGVLFQPVIEKCEGCGRVQAFEGQSYCSTYTLPNAKWALGNCNFATHTKIENNKSGAKVNPLKASKRAAKGGR